MRKEESINRTIESIKVIEEQIKYFEERKTLFFQKKKTTEYNKRIDKLEEIKQCLYRSLEYKIDSKKSEQT